MYVKKITVENLRSFHEKTEIYLTPGMNLILGENNSGKSSILEAFTLAEVLYEPHLSLETKPHSDDPVSAEVRVGLDFVIDKSELWRYLGETIRLPTPRPDGSSALDMPRYLAHMEQVEVSVSTVLRGASRNLIFSSIFNGRLIPVSTDDTLTSAYTCSRITGLTNGNVAQHTGGMRSFIEQTNKLLGRLYKFRAERMNISRCMFGTATVLAPNATNLAECLNSMQSHNSHLFGEFVNNVRQIFPSVHHVQAVPVSNTELEIRTSLVPASRMRPDLAIPLSQSGTGIGQVLAILYVAMNSPTPITIAIDEPNSFLHPKAVRALLAILNFLPIKHQYIITTHSPEVIRASKASTVIVVKNEDGRSKIEMLDPTNLDHLKVGLASIGVRLSDLYGADSILWVEGETEELTFPRIAAEVAGLNVIGVAMLKVNATGDFESTRGVRPRMVFETYRNLSEAGALLPPAVGFVFDSEGRKQNEMADLEKESRNLVRFLPRVCFENYLLHPLAIAAVLSNACGKHIEPTAVIEWIEQNGCDSKFVDGKCRATEGTPLYENEEWLINVNAPKLLTAAFNEIPENPEHYRKTTHSVALAEWLITNCSSHLKPIADILVDLVR
jgi:predicted ATPase